MAEVKRTVLGEVSGKMGELVFRRMNGKKFVSVRPKKYKPTKSIKLKKARSNFGTVVRFAVVTNSVPELKEVWNNSKEKGSNSYHKIIKANSRLVNTETLTAKNKITPDGLELKLSSVSIKSSKLEVTISFPSVKSGLPSTLCMIFYFGKDKIFAQTEKIIEAVEDDVYSLSIPLSSEIKKVFNTNKKPFVYFAVTGVPVKKKVFWTSSFSRNI